MGTRVLTVTPGQSAGSAIAESAAALSAGKLVAFATETVYGVGALAASAEAMDRLRELKDRPARPFSVHLGRPSEVSRYVRDVPPQARWLIREAWPGPVTLLLPVGGRLADSRLGPLLGVLVHEDYIGLRCPDHAGTQAILSAVDGPVVAPSANLAGQPPPRNAQEVLASLDGRIDLLVDSGPTRYGKDSTIVRVGPEGWRIVRAGVYDEGAIRRMLRKVVLLVCTGNTCRSSIAEGLARRLLARRLGVPPARLGDSGYEIVSAGVLGAPGLPPTQEAVQAARQRGVDISAHRSRPLTAELIRRADVVFCMTQMHVDEARRLAPEQADKILALWAGGDILDPVGGGQGVYQRTAELIDKALQSRADEGLL
jgi:protein-tyrosine phosphatase